MNKKAKTKIDLDLDALVDTWKTVQLNGKSYEIQPPDLFQLLKLVKLGQEIKELNLDNLPIDEIVDKTDELMGGFINVFPAFKGESLNISQLFALIDLISTMAQPPENKELQKRGITPQVSKKKIK